MTTEKSLPEAASVWDWDQIAGRLRAIADRAARWSHRYPSLEFDNPAVLNIEEIVSETTVKWISAEATEAWLEAGDRQFTFAVRLRTSACIGKLIFWAVLDPLSSENSISGLVVGRSHRSQVVGKSVRSQGLTPRTGLLCIVATADLTMAADPDLLSLLVKGFFEAATDLDRDAWISWLWGQANRGNLIPSFVRRLGGRILRRAGRQATVSEPATDCVDMAHLLKRAGVFERGFDYVLPSGLHAEVHVNLGTACGNLPVVRRLAHGVKELLDGSDYDTIVSTGWPTATIAREVIRLRPLTRLGVVRHTQCEGIPPIPMSPPAEGSRAVILTDVILTGALVEQTSAVVKRAGALVVDIVTIVDATCSSIQGKDLTFRAICKYDIGAVDSRSCPRCEDGLKRREFNPVACCMTSKKTRPRSPGEFLKENREAADFWKQVDTARAYEHHRIDGNTHFISFIDTERLLAHETVGPMILSKLVAKNPRLIERSDVLLIPGKARARNLASKLARMLASGGRLWLPQIIVARQINGRIQLTADDSRGLRNAKVLIVDTGVSSGATLEGLHNLAVAAGATVVSAAVIISRLSESHEAAISARLEGRFWRLYNLPIRPLAIPDGLRDLCPVCCRRKQIIDAASDSRLRPLVQLSREIRSRKRYRIVASRPKFSETRSAAQLDRAIRGAVPRALPSVGRERCHATLSVRRREQWHGSTQTTRDL